MAPIDTSKFINDGEFFELHPDVIKTVTHYERTDSEGNILETWERDKSGRMVNTTERDLLRIEYTKAKEAVDKINVRKVTIE